tara:strand:- start:327 stop:539 length:213 start_codon:yes stop_codon:yes gene_type:complete
MSEEIKKDKPFQGLSEKELADKLDEVIRALLFKLRGYPFSGMPEGTKDRKEYDRLNKVYSQLKKIRNDLN